MNSPFIEANRASNDYKAKNPLDDLTRINTQNKFDEQLRIENAVQCAKDAIDNAITLINESKHLFLIKLN